MSEEENEEQKTQFEAVEASRPFPMMLKTWRSSSRAPTRCNVSMGGIT